MRQLSHAKEAKKEYYNTTLCLFIIVQATSKSWATNEAVSLQLFTVLLRH